MTRKATKLKVDDLVHTYIDEKCIRALCTYYTLDECLTGEWGKARNNDLLEALENILSDLLEVLSRMQGNPPQWHQYVADSGLEVDFLRSQAKQEDKRWLQLAISLDLTTDVTRIADPPEPALLEFLALGVGYFLEVFYSAMSLEGFIKLQIHVDDADSNYLELLSAELTGTFTTMPSPEMGLVTAIPTTDTSMPDVTTLIELSTSRGMRELVAQTFSTVVLNYGFNLFTDIGSADMAQALLSYASVPVPSPAHFISNVVENVVRFLFKVIWGVHRVFVHMRIDYDKEGDLLIMGFSPLDRTSLPRLHRVLKELNSMTLLPIKIEIQRNDTDTENDKYCRGN